MTHEVGDVFYCGCLTGAEFIWIITDKSEYDHTAVVLFDSYNRFEGRIIKNKNNSTNDYSNYCLINRQKSKPEAATNSCKCPIFELMNLGCKCGGV